MTDQKPSGTAPDPDSEPSRKQRAIEALLLNPSGALAADAAGVSIQNLSQWMQDPEFSDAWSAACRFAFWQRLCPLLDALPLALEKLTWLLHNPEAPKASLLFRVIQTVIKVNERAFDHFGRQSPFANEKGPTRHRQPHDSHALTAVRVSEAILENNQRAVSHHLEERLSKVADAAHRNPAAPQPLPACNAGRSRSAESEQISTGIPNKYKPVAALENFLKTLHNLTCIPSMAPLEQGA